MAEERLLSDRYRIEEKLGAGGMAVVFQAQDTLLERTVAIKILRQDFSQDPAFRERFRQEAKAAANLSHPNIVTVFDFGLDQQHLYIVMEHLPGTNLKDILKNQGRLSVEEALSLMVQACAGIGYAHRAGLIHCDIKSHNLVVSPDKRLKVTDFGIARALASIQPDEQIDYVWGSPQYFSPEQAAGGAPSPASDVYSLGVIMYEMLTGQLPFAGQTMEELSRSHRETMPIAPREINPDIPFDLEQIVLKVLAKEPAARYRTADQLGRVLITYSRPSRIRAVTPPVEEPSLPPEKPPEPEPNSVAPPAVEKPVRANTPVVDIDWAAVVLGLVALVAVGGLIPFWIWVYFVYNPPVP